MSRPFEGKGASAAQSADLPEGTEPAERDAASSALSLRDLQAALDGSACLGAWCYSTPPDRMGLTVALARLLGLAAEVDLPGFLSAIHAEDRPRIESTFYAAAEAGGWFEAEFRTRPGFDGIHWLRLMGRCKHDPATGAARTEGLVFDLTEGRFPLGTPSQRVQRQVNQLADHVIAMQGLVASLGNPPLSKAVHDVAVEVGFELARLLHAAESGSRH